MARAPMLMVGSASPGTGYAPMCQSTIGIMQFTMHPMATTTMDPLLNGQRTNAKAQADFPAKCEVRKPRPTANQKRPQAQKEGRRDCKARGEPHGGKCQRQQAANAAEEDASGKGVISLLQEFVQCSKEFPVPQHRPILQWSFDTHMAELATLKFRAQVSFLLDGVAHHVAGSWQPSKRLAQRDAAERCLDFFVGSWSAYLLEHGSKNCPSVISKAPETAVSTLDNVCMNLAFCGGQLPRWSRDCKDGDKCRFLAELQLLGVLHTFAGVYLSNEDEAKIDTAKRVLWYLQIPGFESAFEPDPEARALTGKDIPSPPTNWMTRAEEGSDFVEAAQRKTALMRVQNRLQQVFGRQLKSGQSIWQWSYEKDPADAAWPPLYKAKVLIPAASQFFEGNWARGQREAQLETCKLVAAFLDSGSFASPSMSGQETPSSISPCSMGGSRSSTSGSLSSLEAF